MQPVHRADSFTSCLKIWEPQPPGALTACTGIGVPFMCCVQRGMLSLTLLRSVFRGACSHSLY